MKKTLLVIVGLCLLAVPAIFAQQVSAMTTPFSVTLPFDNDGFKLIWKDQPGLFNGHQVTPGTYTLKIAFTVDRDLPEPLEIFLLDASSKARGGFYWHEMSNKYNLRGITAGRTHEHTLEYTVPRGSSSTDVDANSLFVFTKGRRNQGSPVITFTEFVITRN